MALQAYSLIPRRTKKTHRVVTDSFTAIIPEIEDLGIVVQQISAYEISQQLKIKNAPTNIIVDNSGSKPFNQADWRITTYFADPKDLAKASIDVINALIKTTRVGKTRLARNSFEIWTVDSPQDKKGNYEFDASSANSASLEFLAASLKPEGKIVIVGPTVDYGRKLYWRPKGNKLKGRASRKAAYDLTTGKTSLISGRRSTNQRDLVLGRTRSKNKGVTIIGRWVIRKGKRWPGIGVGFKMKGKLH